MSDTPRAGFWERLWFPALSPTRLAILRLAVGGYLLHLQVRNHGAYLNLDRAGADTFSGVGLAALLEGALDRDTWALCLAVSLVLNITFLLGLFHRVMSPVFVVMICFVLGYRNSWGQIYHVDNLVVLHALVLSLTPATHDLAVDHWLRARGAGRRWIDALCGPSLPETPDWRFGWGVQLVSMVSLLTYFLAGVSKVTGEAGWRWPLGTNLRDQIAYDALYKELVHPDGATAAVWFIYDRPEILVPAAILTLVLELGAPLVILHRRVAQVFCVLAMGMHWGIDILMSITFPYPVYGLAYLSFFAVERPVLWLRRVVQARRGAAGSVG